MNSCEIPFWKVIHNKVLFNLIILFISTYDSELHFTKYGQYNLKFRNKFKNITSLNDMIKNKQWELLKCKLSHGKKEKVIIDIDGINQLMELGVNSNSTININCGNKSDDQITDEKIIFTQILNQLSINSNCVNQIINLKTSPIQIAIEKDNIFAIKQLLNGKLSPQSINDTLFENAIKNHNSINSIDTLKWLIDNYKHLISVNCKNKLLSLSISNKSLNREKIIQLIIDEKLYNENNDGQQVDKIDGINILSIESESTQLKLIKLLNYFNFNSHLKEQLLNNDCNSISYEIYKYYSKDSKTIYEKFLSKYQEIIYGNDLSIVINFIIYTYNVKLFKQLLSSNLKSIYKLIENFSEYKPLYQFSRPNYPSIEFIEIILTNLKNFENQLLIQSIYQCISNYPFNINNNNDDEYSELILKLSKFSNWYNYYPITYNPIIKSINSINIIINDIETINWIYENVEKYGFLKNKFQHFKTGDLIQFNSFSLVEYAMDKFKTIPLLSFKSNHKEQFKQLFYRNLYFNAINQCDLKTIKQIDESLLIDNIDIKFTIYSSPFNYNSNQTIENFILCKNYFITTNYIHFSTNLFIFFFEFFVFGKNKINTFELTNEYFGFNEYIQPSAISTIFFNSLFVFDQSINFQVFFNQQFNPIIQDSFQYSDYNYNGANTSLYSYYSNSMDKIHLNLSDNKFIDLFGYIKIIIKYNSNYNNCKSIIIEQLTNILNYLFIKSIQSKYINFNQIIEIFNTITEYGIEIKHSLFHSFFYIFKKSSKLFKYLIEFPMFVNGEKKYKILNQIDISVFTFETIKNNSFDYLSFELIKQLSIGLTTDQKNMVLDYTLSYYLEICRIDLFLIQLDKIEIQFKNDNSGNNHFNYSKELYNNCKNLLNQYQFERFISIFQ